jgi:anti-anti-sigma factor
MRVRRRRLDGVTVVELDGTFTECEEVEELYQILAEIGAEGPVKLMLDLENMRYVNGTGLGGLVQLHSRTVKQYNGVLWLCHPSKPVQDLLAITKLNTVFNYGDTDQLARVFATEHYRAACPVCTPPREITVLLEQPWRDCANCGVRLTLSLTGEADEGDRMAECTRLRLPTYGGQYVELRLEGREHELAVHGRLDLFASESCRAGVAAHSRPAACPRDRDARRRDDARPAGGHRFLLEPARGGPSRDCRRRRIARGAAASSARSRGEACRARRSAGGRLRSRSVCR